MSDGMRRELAYLSAHATNRYFIPNWGIILKQDDYEKEFHSIQRTQPHQIIGLRRKS